KSHQIKIGGALGRGLEFAAAKNPAFKSLIDIRRNERCCDLINAQVSQMIAPTGQRLSFAGESARAFALDFCFFEICDAVIRERRFAADRRQLIFTSLVSFNCKCLFGLVQRPYWLIIVILECETPGRLPAVSRVDSKLRVFSI